MKIILVGGTGEIGKAVQHELHSRHEIIVVGHSQGNITVDIADENSIRKMYQKIGKFDALIATTGTVKFGPLEQMTASDYIIGLQNKLMGQVSLVLQGLPLITDGGSFTLTSGILNKDPIRQASSSAMVNGALEGFINCAAIEMPRSIRINLISPTVLSESMDKYGDFFAGFVPVSAKEAAMAYRKSVEGGQTGKVYRVGYSIT